MTVGQDDHHVGVGREDVDKRGEIGVPHFHRLEIGCQLAAAEFELLDDVGDLLKSVHVTVLIPLGVRDHCSVDINITIFVIRRKYSST